MERVILLLIVAAALLALRSEGEGEEGPGAGLTGSWVRVTEQAAFSPRDTAEDAVFLGRMWLSNGWHPPQVLPRDLWCSTDGVTWTRVSADTPYDGYSEMAVYRGKLWAVKASVWNSEDGISWTQVAEKTPFGGRGYGELVVHQGKLWQLGSGLDVWNTTDGVAWTCACEKAPYEARYGSAVTVFKGKLWLMAGSTSGQSDPPEKGYPNLVTHNDVWCSADGASWERVLEHAPWEPRMWTVSKVYAGRMWLIGGYDNKNARNFPDVWYTEDGTEWQQFVSEPSFAARHEVTPYVYDGSLWVVAGNTWPVVNDVWRLTVADASE